MAIIKNTRKKIEFIQPKSSSSYSTVNDSLTVIEKMKILEEMGRPELIEIFKEWKPRPSKRKMTAPLDQRVSITVTGNERVSLNNELNSIKKLGEKITASQFIRNRALGSVDINGWKDSAIETLDELTKLEEQQPELRKRRRLLAAEIEEIDDHEDYEMQEREIAKVDRTLEKLVARGEKRDNRLSGRMSMAEAETVKWRAQRLCISSSDYLRMMIFSLGPNSVADVHMSLESKKRFYISVIDVANNGWGNPPTIYNCTQCGNYVEEIEKLRDRVKQLESFS